MIKNKKSIVVIFLVFLLALFAIYKVSTFSLFEESNLDLTEIIIPNKDYKLKLVFVPSNATSQDYIQVKKVKDNNESVIHNYERYDTVVSHIVTDSTLQLILMNTNLNSKVQDTVYLKLE